MIEILQKIGQLQAQVGALQLMLISEQETPAQLDKCARIAADMEAAARALKALLSAWSEELRLSAEADALLVAAGLDDDD